MKPCSLTKFPFNNEGTQENPTLFLTKFQQYCIIEYYENHTSQAEIARRRRVTRQAVNNTIARATQQIVARGYPLPRKWQDRIAESRKPYHVKKGYEKNSKEASKA